MIGDYTFRTTGLCVIVPQTETYRLLAKASEGTQVLRLLTAKADISVQRRRSFCPLRDFDTAIDTMRKGHFGRSVSSCGGRNV